MINPSLLENRIRGYVVTSNFVSVRSLLLLPVSRTTEPTKSDSPATMARTKEEILLTKYPSNRSNK